MSETTEYQVIRKSTDGKSEFVFASFSDLEQAQEEKYQLKRLAKGQGRPFAIWKITTTTTTQEIE